MDVGKKIKMYLEGHGITQRFVGEKAGIPFDRLNLALNGKRKLTFAEYESICWALDVEVGTFLEAKPLKDTTQPTA